MEFQNLHLLSEIFYPGTHALLPLLVQVLDRCQLDSSFSPPLDRIEVLSIEHGLLMGVIELLQVGYVSLSQAISPYGP